MSRGGGFPTADIGVRMLSDLKLRRLRRDLPDPEANAATLLYLSTVLSSWEEGDRLAAEEADSPGVEATADRVAALVDVGLLDQDHRIPANAWDSWFVPAWERREKKRVGGLEGNRRRWDEQRLASRSLTASDTESHTESESASPPVPTDPPARPNARAGDDSSTSPWRGESVDAAEAVFRAVEARGVRVDRANGHAGMLRELVAAHGVAGVLLALDELKAPIASAGDAAKFISDRLRPRPNGATQVQAIGPSAAERAAQTRARQDPELRAHLAALNGDAEVVLGRADS